MMALNTPARTRFIRLSAPHDVQCPYGHHINQRGKTIEAAVLRCKECGQWLYSIAPRTGKTDLSVKNVLTCAVSTDEIARIEMARLNAFEALLHLRVMDLAAVTVVVPVSLFASPASWRYRRREPV